MLLRNPSAGSIAPIPRLALIALALALAGTPSAAAEAEGAQSWIETVSRRAETILTGPAANEQQRASQLETLIAESFDLAALADFALGRAAHGVDGPRLSLYATAFHNYAVRNFSRLIADLDGKAFKVSGSRPFGERQTLVATRLSGADQEPLEIVWRVRWHEQTPKIVDVFVEGISMALTLRHEFSAFVRKHGLDALVEGLERGSLMPPAGQSSESRGAARHLLQSVLNQGVHLAFKPH